MDSLQENKDASRCYQHHINYLEDIAVVGMAMGFPQDITSPDLLWETILQKRSTVTKVPKSRMNIDAFYHLDSGRRGQVYVKDGNFLTQDPAAFDAPFFSTSTTDAEAIDPQQRLLLEYTYLALENAGIPMEQIAGTRTSVFNGSFCVDWQYMVFRDGEECPPGAALGATQGLNANRISWFFDLKGNSATIDTACSSSLVCLDLGCQGLRLGCEDMSIVTGSNIMLSPDTFHSLTNLTMLSPDGQSHSFEQGGNGYGRGEGFGVLVLKRVSDALRDNDTIRGIIRSTASSQDGRTPSITLPDSQSQSALIRETYRRAGLSMDPVRFFEAHGTGTSVGDPIEAFGVGSVFREYRTTEDPLFVGAIKANLGHLEGASGIAGVIKTILVLEKAVIPPNRMQKLNSKVDADFLNLRFPTEATPWPTQGLRRASVNSFGNGGTNAHVVLDDVFHYLEERNRFGNHLTVRNPPSVEELHDSKQLNGIRHSRRIENGDSCLSPRLLVFSALDRPALQRVIARYTDFWTDTARPLNQQYLDNVAYTLANRRSMLPWTSYAIIRSPHDFANLEALASPPAMSLSSPGLAFVFTGQGAQWLGMGQGLLKFPVFQESLNSAEEYLQDIGCPWMLQREIFGASDAQIDRPDVSQAGCTAVQIALVDLLRSFGIYPTAVLGHSSGEIAAAYCFGALSKTSALKLAYYRGLLANELAGSESKSGAMMSVGLSEAELAPFLKRISSKHGQAFDLVAACVNSPSNVTVSGEASGIDILGDILEHEGVFCKRLSVRVAYHSPAMEMIAEKYRRKIGTLRKGLIRSQVIAMFSSVTGEQITKDELLSADYWVMNLVSQVKFTSALKALHTCRNQRKTKKLDLSHRGAISVSSFIEIGPHSALQRPIKDTLLELSPSEQMGYESCLVRRIDATISLLNVIGHVHGLGYPVAISSVHTTASKVPGFALADLPAYPFDHSKRYWKESRISTHYRFQHFGKLDLLGKPVADWNPHEPRWRNRLRLTELPWMEDHMINDSVIYPGAGMLVMAIEAVYQLADTSRTVAWVALREIAFLRSIPIDHEPEGIETQLCLNVGDQSQTSSKFGSSWYSFALYTYEQGSWQKCCEGAIQLQYAQCPTAVDGGKEQEMHKKMVIDKFDTMKDQCITPFYAERLYEGFGKSGYGYGPAFRCVVGGYLGQGHGVIADVQTYNWPGSQFPQSHVIHPATLDAVMHVAIAGYARGGDRIIDTMIPTYIDSLCLNIDALRGNKEPLLSECAWLASEENRATTWDAFVLGSSTSSIIAEFKGLQLTKIANSSALSSEDQSRPDHPAFSIGFAPDFDLLGSGKPQFRNSHSLIDNLGRLVELLAHKDTGLNILQVATKGQGPDLEILQRLTRRDDRQRTTMPPYRSFNIAVDCKDTFEKVQSTVTSQMNSKLLLLDFEHSAMSQGLETDSDTVLVPLSVLQSTTIISNIRQVLKKGGTLLAWRDAKSAPQDSFPVFPEHPSHALDRSNSNMKEQQSSIMIYRTSLVSPQNQLMAEVACEIIYDTSSKAQQEFFKMLSYTLTSAGGRVTGCSLVDASQNPSRASLFISILEIDEPFLYGLTSDQYTSLKHFLLSARDVIWMNSEGGSESPDPRYGMVQGFFRALHRELADFRPTCLALEPHSLVDKERLKIILPIIARQLGETEFRETEYLEIDGILNIPRIRPDETLSQQLAEKLQLQTTKKIRVKDAPPLEFSMSTVGVFETVEWIECSQALTDVADDEVIIRTRAVGLNFKDCLIALGQLGGATIGQECAGIVHRAGRLSGRSPGDRVILVEPGCFKTFAKGKSRNVIPLPANLSFAVGAAISIQFGTAWEVIHNVARLQKGESILIHAAAGGTGQAAIQLAQLAGAEIFATVGSPAKKKLLMDEYSIPETHIFSSRDTSFAQGIHRVTGGKGVNVIINSLSTDAMLASWDCIAPYGRFVEISKGAINANTALPMSTFGKNASFIGFDGTLYQNDRPESARNTLRTLVNLFSDGTLHTPRQLHVYDIEHLETALRTLQSGTVAGKIVLEIDDHSQIQSTLMTKPTFNFSENATFVIAGGLGGIGRATARWMVGRGAKNLILLSRGGPKATAAFDLLHELQEQGVRVETPPCDISDESRLRTVFHILSAAMPPIKGCVQASLGGQDELFESMEFDNWNASVSCKSTGSWNLHQVLPMAMDFFVLLSSASGLAGIRGQANYDAGNTFEDALSRYRVSHGEKATTLNLGAMSEDGVLAENPELLNRVSSYGTLQLIDRRKYFSLLDYYCDPALPVLSSEKSQIAIGIGLGGGEGLESVDYSRQPMMYPLQVLGEKQAATVSAAAGELKADTRKLFSVSQSLDDASEVVTEAVLCKLGRSLAAMADRDTLDIHRPLQLYGVDSLLAVELRNWINKEFMAEIAVFDTQGPATLGTLALLVARKSKIKHEAWHTGVEG